MYPCRRHGRFGIIHAFRCWANTLIRDDRNPAGQGGFSEIAAMIGSCRGRKKMRMLDEIRAKRDEIYAIARKRKAEKLWVFGSCVCMKTHRDDGFKEVLNG